MTDISAWTSAHIDKIAHHPIPEAPLINLVGPAPVLPEIDLWDMWPLALEDGRTAMVEGGTVWFALSAPQRPDPVERHGLARIRLLYRRDQEWHDCGNALPDELSPGSREWSGSAIFNPRTGKVTLFFTAAGRRGETALSYEQRLYQTCGQLILRNARPQINGWSIPIESVQSDDHIYVRATAQSDARIGTIKAFRDPSFFRDPVDGQYYLLFTASLKQSRNSENGAIGIARASDREINGWELLPPLVHADGVNNELERPHLIIRDGLYYIFWSTQAHVFAPGLPFAPTGLYGMVASRLNGPYQPLNGSGLVIANPVAEPMQAYSWWVMETGEVTSFVDFWGLQGRSLDANPGLARQQFGGIPAPSLWLSFNGNNVTMKERMPTPATVRFPTFPSG